MSRDGEDGEDRAPPAEAAGVLPAEAGDLAGLERLAREVRAQVVDLSHRASTPHLGSALSCVDILLALYGRVLRLDPRRPQAPDRDRAILSKGHAVLALYVVLARRGFFPQELLGTYCQEGGCLPEHPAPRCVPGLEAATGSLGHGLSLGLGMALAARIERRDYRVFVVLSDGECNEGSVWEAAALAPALGLENLAVVVDYNKWQATGRSEEVTSLRPLARKWEAFGWDAQEVDGHDLRALAGQLGSVPRPSGRPLALVAHTVKGKGVSFMEDDNNWHYRIPKAEEVAAAFQELGI